MIWSDEDNAALHRYLRRAEASPGVQARLERTLHEEKEDVDPEFCEEATALALQQAARLTIERDAALAWARRERQAFVRSTNICALTAIAAIIGWAMWVLK